MPGWIIAGMIMAAVACVHNGNVAQGPSADMTLALHDAPLTELAWIGPEGDKLRILTESPGECLRTPADDDAGYLVEVGRAAFRSPLLFGGPAARGGLSCNSCHRNGHDNPAFFLKGLSGASGTADVTSSMFSKVREDAVFNPVPIPSLVGVARKDAFGTRAPAASLHAFIESAVIDEFQGASPPEPVTRGLAAYVAHLERAACPDDADPRTAQGDMNNVARALNVARDAVRRGDFKTADFLLVSAQNALGRVHERYAPPGLKPQRAALEALASELAAVRRVVPDDLGAAIVRIESTVERTEALAGELHAHRRQSLYDLETLSIILGSPSPRTDN